MNQDDPRLRDLPEPPVRRPRRWAISAVWLVPIVALLAAGVLGVRSYLSSGPSITIKFKTAEGIESGNTEVRFKEVPIGKVRRTELADDGQSVLVHVDLIHDAEKAAVEDSRFWVVKPRIGVGGVSGLGTLISGAYIGVDLGRSTVEHSDFEGLEKPPAVTNDQVGRRFTLRTTDLGSLDIGSPVYFRRVPVGRVVDRELDADGKRITLQMFIDAPYDRFVTTQTRFWNASGVDVQINAAGLKLNTQSLATVIAGGLAFATFPEDAKAPVAAANAEFKLFDDRVAAQAPLDAEALLLRLRFYQSTRGLAAGAPVDFQGIEIGRVRSVNLDYDRERRDFWSDVEINVYPASLGRAYESWMADAQGIPKSADAFFRLLIERGLRGQLRTANLITGQFYVALDFDPKAKKLVPPKDQAPLEIPTTRGEFDQIQQQVSNIVTKLEAVPFDEIGRNLRDTLQEAKSLVKQLDGQLVPEMQQAIKEAQKTLSAASEAMSDDGHLQSGARGTLEEVERAARSMRTLADYLQRHPESLLRGRSAKDPAPQASDLPEPPAANAAPSSASPEKP